MEKVGEFDCNNNCLLSLYRNAESADYESERKKALEAGGSCFDEWNIENTKYCSYESDKEVTVLSYCEDTKELRVIRDSNKTLYDTETVVNGSLPVTLYQFELDYRNIDCGMFYAIRLSDGSFFLIDSAHQNSTLDHIRIHDFLRSLTPKGEKIRIAGWFLTHAHQDHIVKFMHFLSCNFEDCEIDRVYYNFPAIDSESAKNWKSGDIVTMREFEALMERRSDIKRVKLHTGQHFFVKELEFYVLCTHEDIYPEEIVRFNDSSTVLLMKYQDTTVFWAGDAGEVESDIIASRYGSFVKSDILQAAHHGFRGGTVELYNLINAPVVLFPTSKEHLEENTHRETTKLARELASEVYIAGEGTVGFELPYTLGTAVVLQKEIN